MGINVVTVKMCCYFCFKKHSAHAFSVPHTKANTHTCQVCSELLVALISHLLLFCFPLSLVIMSSQSNILH